MAAPEPCPALRGPAGMRTSDSCFAFAAAVGQAFAAAPLPPLGADAGSRT